MSDRVKGFALGALVAILFMFVREWGINEGWKCEAWNHRAAVYYFNANDRLRWAWYDDFAAMERSKEKHR